MHSRDEADEHQVRPLKEQHLKSMMRGVHGMNNLECQSKVKS
jgi:hypothetical protein